MKATVKEETILAINDKVAFINHILKCNKGFTLTFINGQELNTHLSETAVLAQQAQKDDLLIQNAQIKVLLNIGKLIIVDTK
jgi:hypothetical protein